MNPYVSPSDENASDSQVENQQSQTHGSKMYGPEKCGTVALIGAPNAGKSTLTNALVGQKVAIVTHKVQTTRTRLTAIGLCGPAQLIFVDTPGIFRTDETLGRSMVHAAWSGAEGADIVGLLVDAARGITQSVQDIIDRLNAMQSTQSVLLILTKIDLVHKQTLLGLAAQMNTLFPFSMTFMVSACNGSGLEDFRQALAGYMPTGPWLYPEDQLADMPERLMAAEITREKLFLQCHQEIPYATTVETESFKQQLDQSLRLEQTIFVERESQKKIILGKKGSKIKVIGQLARQEMAEIFEVPVHLFLFVKIRQNWKNDPERYRAMGLELFKSS